MLRDFLFLFLFFVLLAVWATGWLAFHVAGGLIHLVLVFAVISLVLHLFRGRRAA
ncbi:MAG: lmo0937 family membrane protein [Acidobacteriota bacterium]|nr:lmo0937 family membrane protein [Acidobacteriota bacterium]